MIDTYQMVTDRLIAALEAGTVPWHRSWHPEAGAARNLISQKPYRGLNVLLLGCAPVQYDSPYWLTFKQAKARGGSIRKGEKGSLVILRKKWDPSEHDPTTPSRRLFLMRHYYVFNVRQCEGLDVPECTAFRPRDHEHLPLAELIVSEMPQRPQIRHGVAHPGYCPTLDRVVMPDLSAFDCPEEYYSTLFHELVHSTGHTSRLDRGLSDRIASFGSPDYSREELIAECGAAFLCARCELFPRTVDNQAAYLAGWIKALKGDKRLLPIAAAQAQQAADCILNTPPYQEPDQDSEAADA